MVSKRRRLFQHLLLLTEERIYTVHDKTLLPNGVNADRDLAHCKKQATLFSKWSLLDTPRADVVFQARQRNSLR